VALVRLQRFDAGHLLAEQVFVVILRIVVHRYGLLHVRLRFEVSWADCNRCAHIIEQ
jgi:hypothetical protein